MIEKINGGSSSSFVNGSLSSPMTSRSIGEMGRTTGQMRVENTLQLREGIRRRALTNLCLFVRWTPRMPPPSREIRILYRTIGLAHPEYVVTKRREVKIYRRATPTSQNPSTIPGDVDQSTGFGLTARRQPIIQTRNPRFLISTRVGGKPGCRVFLEERQ